MKITEEWLKKEIALVENNIEYLEKKHEGLEGSSTLVDYENGRLAAFRTVLFHKKMSNRTCKVFSIDVPQWKRNIIRVLMRICDWLEGVEDVSFKRDILEIKSDNAMKRSRKHSKC